MRKDKIGLLFLGICILVAVGLLFAINDQRTSIYLTKLSFHLSSDQKQEQLKALNMLEVAKNESKLRFWLSVLGAKEVVSDLLSDSRGGSSLDCHREAHFIGREAYEIYGARVFSQGNSLCHSGFYHGAMEAFLQEKGTENLAKEMEELCKTFVTGFGEFQCYHGVGHGVLAYEDYDLPTALSLCKKLPSKLAKESCFGGAFMENVVTSEGKGASPSHTTSWVSDDPHFPCNYFKDDFDLAVNCYHMQTSRMLIMFRNDFDRVLPECLKAPDNLKPACFRSFGRDAAGVAFRDPRELTGICTKLPQEPFVKECVLGALHVIVDFWGESLESQASEFCKNLTPQYKNTCYDALAKRLPGLFTEQSKRDSVCKTLEPSYQSLCTDL